MLLTIKDIELLKLIALCKYLPSPSSKFYCSNLYDFNWINIFLGLDLLSESKDKKVIRPRPSCYRLLESLGLEIPGKENRVQYNESTVDRGIISTDILLTFYEAGLDVHNYNIDLLCPNSYFSSSAGRKDFSNRKYSSTRFHGVFTSGETAYIVFFVDNIGIHVSQEMRLFASMNQSYIKNTAIIFMGKSTLEIADNTFAPIPTKKKRPKTIGGSVSNGVTFHEAYKHIGIPIHFIPIGAEGALMLKFMQIPNYRECITKTFMGTNYRKPYEDMPDTDTIYFEKPFYPTIISVDMDLKRIDRAISTAQEKGYGKVFIFALPEQCPYLKKRYQESETAIIDGININLMNARLQGALNLFKPSNEPYVSKEKRCIIAENITNNRKTGN